MKIDSPADLTAWRHEHNLTQTQLADQLGIARNTINRYENGLKEITNRKMLELALEGLHTRLARAAPRTHKPANGPPSNP